jgi:hypothetical protein
MYDIIEWHCDKAQSADIPLKRTSGCEIRIWFSCNNYKTMILMQLSLLFVIILGSKEKCTWNTE